MITSCQQSINQALNYIYQNLDKNLTVTEIAEHCCFSKYHFNRLFKAVVGESIYAFIKRMKLERAAFQLKTARQPSITEIASAAGYSSSNFAVAFRQHFGLTPRDFCQSGQTLQAEPFARVFAHVASLKKSEAAFAALDSRIKLLHLPAMILIYKRFIGNYSRDLPAAWEGFCQDLTTRGLLTNPPHFIGISYDDPLLTAADRCIYDMCLAAPEAVGPDTQKLAAGLYACYEFHDCLPQMMLTFNELFLLWLPFCRYSLDDRASLEIYHSAVEPDGRIRADICLPIRNFS